MPMAVVTAEFDRALSLAAERSERAQELGRLDDDVIAALAGAGLGRALMPIELGGRQDHPRVLIDAVARVAAADASTGWCLSISAGCKLLSGYIPEVASREMFSDPDVEIASMFAPIGVATRSLGLGGSYDATLTGRWPFTSNCVHSRWIGLGALISDDRGTEARPRVVFVDAERLVIEETWDTSGLKATGSHHVHADTTPVDLARSFAFSDHAWPDGPLWRMPMFTVLAPVMVAAPLGIARGAVDMLFETIASPTTQAIRGRLIDDPVGLAELAAADAALRAAHAGLISAVDDVWTLADARQHASRSKQALVLLAVHHAIDTAVDAVSVAHRLCGGAAAYSGHPLLATLHDVHTARQHILFAHQHRALLCRIAAGTDEKASPFIV